MKLVCFRGQRKIILKIFLGKNRERFSELILQNEKIETPDLFSITR